MVLGSSHAHLKSVFFFFEYVSMWCVFVCVLGPEGNLVGPRGPPCLRQHLCGDFSLAVQALGRQTWPTTPDCEGV